MYPYTVPALLPLAQIAMTASVYTTVITCLDRYIAICRPGRCKQPIAKVKFVQEQVAYSRDMTLAFFSKLSLSYCHAIFLHCKGLFWP